MDRSVVLCEDCRFSTMSRHHYLRLCWQEFAQKNMGLAVCTVMERGYNSGFVGLRRKNVAVLQTWREAMDQLGQSGVPLEHLKPGSRRYPFCGTDQDMMNVAAMAHGDRLVTLGTEGMGFTVGMTVMWHAVESPKPWRMHFIWDVLRTGRAVPHSHRHYWKYAAGPVQSWTSLQCNLRRLDLRLAIILSRFIHSA